MGIMKITLPSNVPDNTLIWLMDGHDKTVCKYRTVAGAPPVTVYTETGLYTLRIDTCRVRLSVPDQQEMIREKVVRLVADINFDGVDWSLWKDL